MKNFKIGDKVKSRISGNYGIVVDNSTQISLNKLFVKVEFMIGSKQIETIQKRYLDYVTPEEWDFVRYMEEERD